MISLVYLFFDLCSVSFTLALALVFERFAAFFALLRCYESNEWITISFVSDVPFIPFGVFGFCSRLSEAARTAHKRVPNEIFENNVYVISMFFFLFSSFSLNFTVECKIVRIFAMNEFTSHYLHVHHKQANANELLVLHSLKS